MWAAARRVCLAQTAVEIKCNELVAIPQVLDLVDVHQQVAAHFAPLLRQAAAHEQRDKCHGRGELRQVWFSAQ